MGRGPEMRDVELVEVEPGGGLDPWRAGSAPGSLPDLRAQGANRLPGVNRRRWTRRGAATTVLLALMVAGVALGAERRETARIATLAAVPGVVAPLDGPVDVLWRLPGTPLTVPRWTDGLVVGVVRAPGGGVDVVGLDPATRAEQWRTAVSAPGEGSEPSASCESPPTAAGADRRGRVLVCLVVDDTDTADAVGIGSVTYATRTRLVVLDAATGEIRSDERVAPTTATAVLGPDLLVAHVDDDGHARVARVDPLDAAERWTFRSPDPVPPDELGQHRLRLETDDELVLLDAGASWVLTAGGGELRHSWPANGRRSIDGPFVQLVPGRGAVIRVVADRAGTTQGEVVDVRSSRQFTVPGYPTTLRPDDGSLPDVLLVDRTDGAGRTAYDLRSGRELWTSDDAAGGTEVLLDGRVLSADGSGVRAVDGRTGEQVWTAPLPEPGFGSLATDGRVLLVSSGRAAGGAHLTALDVDDGRERWSTELRTDVFLQSVDGGLYGFTPDGIVVLGDPAHRG